MSQRSLKSEIAQKARKKVGTQLGQKRQINRILTSDRFYLLKIIKKLFVLQIVIQDKILSELLL